MPDAITEDLSPEETAALEKAVNQISGTGLTESANEQTAADKIDKLPIRLTSCRNKMKKQVPLMPC